MVRPSLDVTTWLLLSPERTTTRDDSNWSNHKEFQLIFHQGEHCIWPPEMRTAQMDGQHSSSHRRSRCEWMWLSGWRQRLTWCQWVHVDEDMWLVFASAVWIFCLCVQLQSPLWQTGTKEENEIPGFLEISAELITLILETGALTNEQTSSCHFLQCDVLYKRTTMEKASGMLGGCFPHAFIDHCRLSWCLNHPVCNTVSGLQQKQWQFNYILHWCMIVMNGSTTLTINW